MTQEKWLDAVTDLDSDILDRYFTVKSELAEKKKVKNTKWVKWGAIAACITLIVCAIISLPVFGENGLGIFYPPYNSQQGNATPGLHEKTFHFNSYEGMIGAFAKSSWTSSSFTIQDYMGLLGEPYTRFVKKVVADKCFPHPMIDGKPISYRNEEGFHNIAFSVNELYKLPWIWYYPYVSTGENFYIKMTYLPDDIAEDPETATASEVIKALSPNSPNVNNKGKQHKDIYNKEITLADRNVTALVYEYKEDTRNTYFFVYDNLLVQISSDPAVWTEEWFASLSFESVR